MLNETIIDCKKNRLSSANVNSFHYLQCWGPVGDRGFNYLTSASLSATVIILPLLSFQSIQMNLFPQYKTPFYCFNFLYSWILLETSVWCSVIKQKRERENVAHIHFIFPKGAHFRIIQNALESIYQWKICNFATITKKIISFVTGMFFFLGEFRGVPQIVSIIEKHIRVMIKGEWDAITPPFKRKASSTVGIQQKCVG